MRTYQNYHCHKMYTNLRVQDSIARPKDYTQRALELGHGILSSAEHGWQGNYFETYKTAKVQHLKPLIGVEVYWVKNRHSDDAANCHIFIGAKNERGRQALNDILSEANITGFYRQPRLDVPLLLSLPKDDVILTTACVAYWKYEDIDQITQRFAGDTAYQRFPRSTCSVIPKSATPWTTRTCFSTSRSTTALCSIRT